MHEDRSKAHIFFLLFCLAVSIPSFASSGTVKWRVGMG